MPQLHSMSLLNHASNPNSYGMNSSGASGIMQSNQANLGGSSLAFATAGSLSNLGTSMKSDGKQ